MFLRSSGGHSEQLWEADKNIVFFIAIEEARVDNGECC